MIPGYNLVLAKTLNEFYISTASDVSLLDLKIHQRLPAQNENQKGPDEVRKKLSKMNPLKSVGPTDILNYIWKTSLLNFPYPLRRFLMSHFPAACSFLTVWKDSRAAPIPKVTPVTADEYL